MTRMTRVTAAKGGRGGVWGIRRVNPGSWEDPLNDSANHRECTKDCLDGGIGSKAHLPTKFPWTGAQ